MTFQMGSADIERLLVTLHDKHTLYALAKDKRGFAWQELAGIIADILDFDLSLPEQELISDIFIALMKQAEQDLKLEIAKRLAREDNAPLRLVLHLAHDEIDVALPILLNSQALEPFDIDCILSATPISHWREIAKRSDLTEPLMNRLAEADDEQTDINLLENKKITLPELAMEHMARLAKDHPMLLHKLCARPELTQDIVALIYQFAGEDMKTELSYRFDLGQQPQQNIVALVDHAVNDLQPEKSHTLPPTLQDCITYLIKGRHDEFLSALSDYCGLSQTILMDCLMDVRGRKFAALCKACDIPKSAFVQIFLKTGALRRNIFIKPDDLNKALVTYNGISRNKAKLIFDKYRR